MALGNVGDGVPVRRIADKVDAQHGLGPGRDRGFYLGHVNAERIDFAVDQHRHKTGPDERRDIC